MLAEFDAHADTNKQTRSSQYSATPAGGRVIKQTTDSVRA